MIDLIEVASDIRIDHPELSGVELVVNGAQRAPTSSPGSKPVAVPREVAFEDWLQDDVRGFLHDAVSDGGQSAGGAFLCSPLFLSTLS